MEKSYVKKLIYKLIPDEQVDYSKAFPVSDETDEFAIHLDNYFATFTMKKRLTSKAEAISIAENYIERWRVIIGIKQGPKNLKFELSEIEMSDKKKPEFTASFH